MFLHAKQEELYQQIPLMQFLAHLSPEYLNGLLARPVSKNYTALMSTNTFLNGIGKSTLLKTLVGQIPSIHGHYKFSDQVTIGYFEQNLIWDDTARTPIQIVSDNYPDMVVKEVRCETRRIVPANSTNAVFSASFA